MAVPTREHPAGLALEFKSPWLPEALASDRQRVFLERLERSGWRTLVSNDYDAILVALLEHLGRAHLRCSQCRRVFRTPAELEAHGH